MSPHFNAAAAKANGRLHLTDLKVQEFLLWLLAFSVAVGVPMYPESALAQELSKASNAKPSIVLVHGAFFDGSSWQRVIPILERDGYTVTAVQNPLTSLPDDVATTKRVIIEPLPLSSLV
jgi:pimeloyl-ACP methyl ester carboxylesterase